MSATTAMTVATAMSAATAKTMSARTTAAIPTGTTTTARPTSRRAITNRRDAITDMIIPLSHGGFIQKAVTHSDSESMTTEADGCGALEQFVIDITQNVIAHANDQ